MLLFHNIIRKCSTSSSSCSIRSSDCIQSALVRIGSTTGSRRHTSSLLLHRNQYQPSVFSSSISSICCYSDVSTYNKPNNYYNTQIRSSCCTILRKRNDLIYNASNYYYSNTTTTASTKISNVHTTIPAAATTTGISTDDELSSSININVHDPTREVFINDLYDTSNDDDDNNTADTTTSCNKRKVTVIILNRPKANAMGYVMIQQLQQCLDYLENIVSTTSLSSENNSITAATTLPPRCIIITSYSKKVFCAGADLKERYTMSIEQTEDFVCILRNTIQRIADIPIPTISIIDGIAVGGGFELILATDIRIGSIQSKYGLPENSLGIVPGAGGTQRLSRLIGVSRAKELIFTSQIISASTAYEYGIIQHLVEVPNTLDITGSSSTCSSTTATTGSATFQKGLYIAYKIANNAPIAIRASKYAIDTGITKSTITDALDIERQAYSSILNTEDRIEGLTSFKEGRKPNYNGN